MKQRWDKMKIKTIYSLLGHNHVQDSFDLQHTQLGSHCFRLNHNIEFWGFCYQLCYLKPHWLGLIREELISLKFE